MSGVRLSICIATLNRGDYIGATLDTIIPQLTPEVEVVVLDGGSRDDTAAVVQGRAACVPALRYVRLERPNGVDRDFTTAVAHARGEYCWLMGDDDLLRPGAVARVLAAVAGGYPLVVVNAEVRDAAADRLVEPRRLAATADRAYAPHEADAFFADVGPYLSFIGCVVIRRALWEARDKASYFGTEFVHVGVIFQAPLPGAAYVLAEPLITIRLGNATWSARSFEIWTFKWPRLVWSFAWLSPAARARVAGERPWARAKPLLLARAHGVYGPAQYASLVRPRLTSRRERAAAALIARLPVRAVNRVARWYFGRVRPDGRIAFELDASRRGAAAAAAAAAAARR